MAEYFHPLQLQWRDSNTENGEIIDRVWRVNYWDTSNDAKNTLAFLNQEKGDVVNGTTYYEILNSALVHQRGKMSFVLRVRGFRSDLFAGVARTTTFRELKNSRVLNKSRNGIRYTRRWECDDSAIQEGEKGQNLFIITRGVVRVSKEIDSESKDLATLLAGYFFGEIALIEEKPRNATCRAVTPCSLFVLKRVDFMNVMKKYPAIHTMIKKAAEERKQD